MKGGCSKKADNRQAIIFGAYLDPNSSSMHKTIEGVSPYWRFPQPIAVLRRNLCSLLYIRGGIDKKIAAVLQPEKAKAERRLISLDLCLISSVKKRCVIVQNAVETCSTP